MLPTMSADHRADKRTLWCVYHRVSDGEPVQVAGYHRTRTAARTERNHLNKRDPRYGEGWERMDYGFRVSRCTVRTTFCTIRPDELRRRA